VVQRKVLITNWYFYIKVSAEVNPDDYNGRCFDCVMLSARLQMKWCACVRGLPALRLQGSCRVRSAAHSPTDFEDSLSLKRKRVQSSISMVQETAEFRQQNYSKALPFGVSPTPVFITKLITI
jgi:hypothetical protein